MFSSFSYLIKYSSKTKKELFLGDLTGGNQEEVILIENEVKITIYDHTKDVKIKEVTLGEEFNEAKKVKIIEEGNKQKLWLRAKKETQGSSFLLLIGNSRI